MRLFTKSAFKQALFCPASLYYFYDREHYANQMNEDDFLLALADGGNQVGDLAKVYYDVHADADIKVLDGQDPYDKPLEITSRLFKRDNVNIAEAAFRWKTCFIRADIIEKKGNHIHLIEVKAKSWNEKENSFVGKNDPNRVDSKILEYVYDVAFQKYIIQKALGPGFTVKASLMMADKTVKAEADGINQYFRVVKDGDRATIVREPGADALRNSTWVLKPFDVDELCDRIIAGTTSEQMGLMGCQFKEFADKMSRLYVDHEQVNDIQLKGACFKCPFYSNEKTPGMLDGKRECWKKAAGFSEDDFNRPLVGDLWCGLSGGKSLKDDLTKAGKYFLDVISEDDIKPKGAKTDYVGLSPMQRRLLQIGLATNREDLLAPFKDNLHNGVYLDIDGLKDLIKSKDPSQGWHYPYHMIDFETTAVALPFYVGRRPYEQVAFQFSHHIIKEDGSIQHYDHYLNTKKHFFPNFEFVRELKRQLEGDNGTIFRYSTHENTILRCIYSQLDESNVEDKQELMDFINSITYYKDGSKKIIGSRNMVDLLEVVRGYYYHPDMKGSNSIKAVLPAILNSSKRIQEKYSKPIYGREIPSKNYAPEEAFAWIKIGADGKVINPYKELKPIADFLGVTEEELDRFDRERAEKEAESSIANGGAALAAYTKLQFSDERLTQALEKALLRYCELDTMSMVFIWEYFHEMTGA